MLLILDFCGAQRELLNCKKLHKVTTFFMVSLLSTKAKVSKRCHLECNHHWSLHGGDPTAVPGYHGFIPVPTHTDQDRSLTLNILIAFRSNGCTSAAGLAKGITVTKSMCHNSYKK